MKKIKEKNRDFEKSSVNFVPVFEPEAGMYAIGVELDKKVGSFVHWIESSDGTICTLDSLFFAKKFAETEKRAIAICAFLKQEFLADRIGWRNINL